MNQITIYGLNSCIVAICEKTKVYIENIIIYIDNPFSSAIVDLNGAKIYLKNTTIITATKYSKGISSLNKGFVDISQDSNITTIGKYSPCFEINKKESRINIQNVCIFIHNREREHINKLFFGRENENRLDENSQILAIWGTYYVCVLDCEFCWMEI